MPGLESSSNNLAQEDAMYNQMMQSLLEIVLCTTEISTAENGWVKVRESGVASTSIATIEPWRNTLEWRMFTKKLAGKVRVS